MAGAAGFPVLHVLHGCFFVRPAFSLVKTWMAFIAAKLFNVAGVWENCLANYFVLKGDVSGMAFDAISFDAESFCAVVTGTAGFAVLHVFHAGVIAISLLYENFRVAGST